MLGLQLYTVREKLKDENSALFTLTQIKNMGYDCVQLAGGIETVEFTAQMAKKVDIPVIGILTNIDTCENQSEKLFELARFCGAKDIGISSTITTEDEAYAIIKRVNAVAKQANENGFSFSYHNHSNEFIKGQSGKTLIQLLKEGFDPSFVSFMLDTYWIQHSGTDVRDFLEKFGARTKILHLKDMQRTSKGPTFAEIGEGNMNFEGIIETAKKVGIKHFVVEQDTCERDSLESARISIENTRKIL